MKGVVQRRECFGRQSVSMQIGRRQADTSTASPPFKNNSQVSLTNKVCLGGGEEHFDLPAHSSMSIKAGLLTGASKRERDSSVVCSRPPARPQTSSAPNCPLCTQHHHHRGSSGPIKPGPKACPSYRPNFARLYWGSPLPGVSR